MREAIRVHHETSRGHQRSSRGHQEVIKRQSRVIRCHQEASMAHQCHPHTVSPRTDAIAARDTGLDIVAAAAVVLAPIGRRIRATTRDVSVPGTALEVSVICCGSTPVSNKERLSRKRSRSRTAWSRRPLVALANGASVTRSRSRAAWSRRPLVALANGPSVTRSRSRSRSRSWSRRPLVALANGPSATRKVAVRMRT